MTGAKPADFAERIRPRLQGTGLIWAETGNGVIGSGGTMPWHVPEDLKHFSALTTGHPVIMGRKTWESFPAKYRPLPGRTNIVVTRQHDWAGTPEAGGAVVVPSLEAGFAEAGDGLRWVIGGGEIFRLSIQDADFAVVTVIDSDVDGDTHAPGIPGSWTQTAELPEAGGWFTSAGGARFRFTLWERA
ncbi:MULTISPECIES: dihydrofolate reductase [Arthrobacter]|uniref:Dihydrofolate reductase n=2 Tax=Arthrobacter TaxID=1663 RepID=A0ABU9KPA6_9MICC|nr:dihydrofolate reductase [Arthrobacter sp. YJM1]MDP5227923.1 dihydrofolate reductase [Arthrobacter sp. YJM1]